MKKIAVKLYKFTELSKDAKQKAIEQFHDINVDYSWWEFVYDDFKTLASYFGVSVDLKKTYFTGFYHQGQGSSYTADVDVLKMINCLKNKSWKEYTPNEEINLLDVNINSRIVTLIQNGIIDVWAQVSTANRESSIRVGFDANYTYNNCNNYDRIEFELSKLENIVSDVCEELNHLLFKNLREEYEYQVSKEAIEESIITNEYYFAKDGRFFTF